MQYVILTAELILYAQICAVCLIIVAACRVAEFVQTMRIKAVELEAAKQHQQNMLAQAEEFRISLEQKRRSL